LNQNVPIGKLHSCNLQDVRDSRVEPFLGIFSSELV